MQNYNNYVMSICREYLNQTNGILVFKKSNCDKNHILFQQKYADIFLTFDGKILQYGADCFFHIIYYLY